MSQRNRISILLLLTLLFSVPCGAQSLQQQQQRRDRLEKDIAILRKQLSSTSQKSEQAISSLSLLQAQKRSRQKLVNESDKTLAALDVQIRASRNEVRRQQAVLDTLQKHYSRLVLGAYKNRDIKIWYMYILASENVGQAFRRFGYFKGLASQIQTQARRVEAARDELEARTASLLELQAKEKRVRNQRAAELKKIKEDEAQTAGIVAKLKKDKKAYQKSLAAKQNEKKALDKSISKMLQAAATGRNRKPVDYALAKSFENNKGKLPWPVEGPVTEHYGPYQNKELRLSLFNNGINIASDAGAAVHAVFDGVVSNVMIAPGYGQCVLIQHGDYYTSYCKLKTTSVHQGDKVKTGQVIGEVATIMGRTQLYFLIWQKKYLDPETWLRER